MQQIVLHKVKKGGFLMNIALIIAGGSGQRMHQQIPKQFINVYDKPIIVYTLQAFQKHPDIDAICVVCIKGWHDILKAYARQFGITKLKWVINGGENGQSSIRNGIFELEKDFSPDDIVLIHDAIRPMVSQDIISDCIITAREKGSAISCVPCTTAVLNRDFEDGSHTVIARDILGMTQTPQGFPLGKLSWAHREALNRGITNSVASCTLMVELGETVCFSIGSETNVKLTTPADLKIFKALLAIEEDRL